MCSCFLGQNKVDVAHLQCSLDWAEWTNKLIWNSAAYLMTWWLTGVGSRAATVAKILTLSVSLFEGCDAQNGCGPLTPNTPLLHLTPKCALSLLDGGVLEAPKMLPWPILTHDAAVYSFFPSIYSYFQSSGNFSDDENVYALHIYILSCIHV